MDTFFTTITWLGSLWILLPTVLLISSVLWYLQKGTESLFLLLCLGGTTLVSHLLKLGIARPRPPAENLLVVMPVDFSFPSAHTSQIAAIALALGLLLLRNAPLPVVTVACGILLMLVAVVGYSRIYLQVHYLSDVLAGAVVAIVVVLLWARILGILFKN